jgi:adenosine deaminase
VASLSRFIEGIPKAELHLHLEGSLEPELAFEFAERSGIEIPFSSPDELKAAYHFASLQGFLDIYYARMNVLRSERDFYDLTRAYLEKAHKDNVVHAEVFFDPQAHTERGIPLSVVIPGISRALREAEVQLGISYRLIMCFLRHLSEESAFLTLERARPYLDSISAVGLDSTELGHPPSKFERVFRAARRLGLACVAHAGEEGPPDYVWEALDILRVDRIDHGNRAVEDPLLVAELRRRGVALTLCPLSNLRLRIVGRLSDHPLKAMLDEQLLVTVNSDDPAYFGGYVNQNYLSVAEALDLDQVDITRLAKNSFRGSLLSDHEKKSFIAQIDRYRERFQSRDAVSPRSDPGVSTEAQERDRARGG